MRTEIRNIFEDIVRHICKANGCKSGEIAYDVEGGRFRICYDGQRWFGESPNKWGGDIDSMFGGDNFQIYVRVDFKPADTKIYDSYARILIKERTESLFNVSELLNMVIEKMREVDNDMVINNFFKN